MDNLKIAFITNFCTHYTAGFFAELAERVDTDFYFYSDGNEAYWEHRSGIVQSGSFRFRYLSGFTLGQTRIAPTLAWHLLSRPYDVYIKCINGKFALPLTYAIARLRGKPFILRTGVWADLSTGLHRLLAPLVLHLYRHSDAIVAYGEHVKTFLIGKGVPAERIFVAPHAVDNRAYNQPVPESAQQALRTQLSLAPGQKALLYLGRLVPSKGCMDLLEAFAALDAPEAVLVIVGDGPERPRMEEFLHRRGLDGRVRFTGHIPPSQIAPYYAISYAMLLPSITTAAGREPWGLTVNEAFNAGLPVIATDAVGAAAGGLVQNGVNGFVVPEQNPAELARAMQRLLREPELREAMSAAARTEIAKWTHARMAENVVAALRYVNSR